MRALLALVALSSSGAFVDDFVGAAGGSGPIRARDFMFEPLRGGGVRVTKLGRDQLSLESGRREAGLGARLQAEAWSRLAADPATARLHVSVNPIGGVAELRGELPHVDDAARAAQLVLALPEIDQVDVEVGFTAPRRR